MAKRKLINITFVIDKYFNPFSVNGYKFYSQHTQSSNRRSSVYTSTQARRDNRNHKQNAYVEFFGNQKSSILFGGGRIGAGTNRGTERKFLEDILVVGSILTGKNWQLYSRRNYREYPVVSSMHLECISKDAVQCEKYLKQAVSKILDPQWQKQYANGFHLVMLLNNANTLNAESRFLSNVVIWEWLYPHIKNSSGATSRDESENLHEIFTFILENFWPNKPNSQIFTNSRINGKSKNIFYVLRNQLAHSGKLPIDRDYAETWMKQLSWSREGGMRGIEDYLKFLDRLTQIVVLKTLDIDGEDSLGVFNFSESLDLFLQTGKI